MTVCDWRLMVAAFAYEMGYAPVMSDMTYDTLSKLAEERGTQIPGFQAYTGSWVKELDQEELQKVYTIAMSENRGCGDLHGPAIKFALDTLGIEYQCCNAEPCWAKGDGNEI